MKSNTNKLLAFCLSGIAAFSMVSCAGKPDGIENLIVEEPDEGKVVNLFGPMEKSKPGVDNLSGRRLTGQ